MAEDFEVTRRVFLLDGTKACLGGAIVLGGVLSGCGGGGGPTTHTTPTPIPTATPTPTPQPSNSSTPTPTPTPQPSGSSSPTPTPIPTATPTPIPTATPTPIPTATPTPTPAPTPTPGVGVIGNGTAYLLPLVPNNNSAEGLDYAGSEDGARDTTRAVTRGMQIGNEFTYEGLRLSGQCVSAMDTFYLSRYGFNLPHAGGNAGAFNFGNSGRTIDNMTRIDDTSSDPRVHDMVVIDSAVNAGSRGVGGAFGHVFTVAEVKGNRVVVAVDSNWNGPERGGVHVIDLKRYHVLCYHRPNSQGTVPQPRDPNGADVTYRGHFADLGDLDTVSRGEILGTVGESRRQEAIQIQCNDRDVYYQAHVAEKGWLDEVSNGNLAGTKGESRQMEAVRIRVSRGHVTYYVHVESIGWTGPYSDGQDGGTTGRGLRMEAVAIYVSD